MAEKAKIHIKKSHEGRFLAWCKRHGYASVTGGCIAKAKAAGGAAAKMATFAKNAKSWKH